MLRKRLEQFFAEEGASGPVMLEIPKGNYAPVFREREEATPLPVTAMVDSPPHAADWRLWSLCTIAILFACSTAFLVMRGSLGAGASEPARTTVTVVWAQVLPTHQANDNLVHDAANWD